MTLIELLEIIVKKTELNSKQRKDAELLITELKQVNAFGTAVRELDAKHECVARWVDTTYLPGYGGSIATYGHWVCKYCGRKMNV